MFAQAYNIIIDQGVGAPVYDREVDDVLNATDKRFLYMQSTTVQMTGVEVYYTYMAIHTSTLNKDISI